MITWPSGLPQFVNQDGYNEQRVDGKLVTKMDSGPSVNRSIFTATPYGYNIAMNLTSTQVDILDTFYYTECKNGVVSFEWIHPRRYTSADMRFTSLPSISNAGYDNFMVSFSVEILP